MASADLKFTLVVHNLDQLKRIVAAVTPGLKTLSPEDQSAALKALVSIARPEVVDA